MLCLEVWKREELWRTLKGEKYNNKKKTREIFHIFWKSNFLDNDKLMLMISILKF